MNELPSNGSTLPSNSDIENAQIFSQQDVIAYLERKGLFVDTIKRLQIYDTTPPQPTHSPLQQSSSKHSNRNKKSAKHELQDKLPPVHTDACKRTHSPRYYQEEYKKQQKAKRMTMIKNYSDAQLLKMLNKKRTNGRKRNKKKKRRTSSLGVRHRLTKRRSPTSKKTHRNEYSLKHSESQPNIVGSHKKKKQSAKLRQLEKYYALKLNHTQIDRKRVRSKKRKASNKKSITTQSVDLLDVMEQILGKEKKNAIEEYYKNLYSAPQQQQHIKQNESVKLPQIVHVNNVKLASPKLALPLAVNTVQPLPPRKQKAECDIVAAVEPAIFNSEWNEFEICDSLKGLGMEMLLFSTAHNIEIWPYEGRDAAVFEMELNLAPVEGITRFDAMLHLKDTKQNVVCSDACVYAIESIEVDPNDWNKILEDKRKPPRTSPGSTATLPLFIPREQRSICHAHKSELDSRQSTDTVRTDVLKQLSAPNVHKIAAAAADNKTEKQMVADGESAINNIIRDTMDNVEHMRNEHKTQSDDEFIAYVTDLIVKKISAKMDISSVTNIPQFVQKAVDKDAAAVSPQALTINTNAIHAKANANNSELIGNEPLTQGARANHTEVGTALLSIKMSGLKQRLTPSTTATASIDPYNTNQPHSQLIASDRFGANAVTPARPPNQQHFIPEVIHGNTSAYQFQSVQQQPVMYAQHPPMLNMASPMMNAYPPMYYGPYPYPPAAYMSPMNAPQPHSGQQKKASHAMMSDISEDTMSVQPSVRRSKSDKRSSSRRKKTLNSPNAVDVKDLFTKAINNRHSAVEELFAANMNPNTKDEHGNTILHVASQNGNKRLIKVALRWGANINEQNKQGQTALHYLFAYKYENLAAYLISKGADDTIQNEFGYTCYDGLRPSSDA
eukprot:358089_1